MKPLILVISLIVLAACTSTGRYAQHQDSKPKTLEEQVDFGNPEPKYEPYLKASMRPYSVLGKHYTPLKTGKGYEDTGIASWYGQKFHGHLTANGEIYNMFAMSAAHKTLPLPSFVKVTNLTNGKQTIVRVNDRGPFHHGRIIDLSYAAAMKIGVLDTGTAQVKVEIIHVDENNVVSIGKQKIDSDKQLSKNAVVNNGIYIQVAALQDKQKTKRLVSGLEKQYKVAVEAPHLDGLFRLRLGPFNNPSKADALLQKLKQDGYNNAFRIFTAP